jgi:hypothetical protein
VTVTRVHTLREALLHSSLGTLHSIFHRLLGDPFAFSGSGLNDLGASFRVSMQEHRLCATDRAGHRPQRGRARQLAADEVVHLTEQLRVIVLVSLNYHPETGKCALDDQCRVNEERKTRGQRGWWTADGPAESQELCKSRAGRSA